MSKSKRHIKYLIVAGLRRIDIGYFRSRYTQIQVIRDFQVLESLCCPRPLSDRYTPTL